MKLFVALQEGCSNNDSRSVRGTYKATLVLLAEIRQSEEASRAEIRGRIIVYVLSFENH